MEQLKFAFDLRPRQLEAIEFVNQGKSVLVELPTGYGKTAIAVHTAIKCKSEGKKSILLSPFKSLSAEHTQTFSEYGLEVVKYDSDTYVDDKNEIKLGELTIFTYEKFDSILRKEKNQYLLGQIGYVIIDEIHVITSPRGKSLEASLLKVKILNKNVKFLGLSATLGDEKNLLKFLNMVLVKAGDDERPVKLIEKIVPLDQDSKLIQLSNDTEGISSLVFCSSRKRTEDLAYHLNGTAEPLTDMLKKGYGYHNAGLELLERQMVEKYTRENPIKCLCATSTLQAGVNFKQFKKVITFDCVRYSMLNGEEPIPVSELRQQGGRARGEEGKDQFVEAIYYVPHEYYDHFAENWKFADVFTNFNDEKSIRTIILDLIVSGISNNIKSLFTALWDNGMEPIVTDEQIADAVKYLLDNKLIYPQGGVYIPSFVGKMCIYLYIDIETALYLSREIYVEPNEDLRSVLLKVFDCNEFIDNVVVRKEDSNNIEITVEYLSSLGLYKNQDPRLIKCFYLLFNKYIEKQTNNKFKIYFVKGDYWILKSSAERILLAGSIIGKDTIKSNCKRLILMVKMGTFDLNQALLREIPQVGDVRVERLLEAKINKITKIVELTPTQLSKIVKVNIDIATKMLQDAKRIVFDNLNELKKESTKKEKSSDNDILEEFLEDEEDPDKDFTY